MAEEGERNRASNKRDTEREMQGMEWVRESGGRSSREEKRNKEQIKEVKNQQKNTRGKEMEKK